MSRFPFAAIPVIACLSASHATQAQPAPTAQAALEARLDASVHPDDLKSWMKRLASEPNHVGSPHDKANAEWILAQFKSWGWDAHIETFQVLYPTPKSETLELISPRRFKVTLQEPPIKGDTSAAAKEPALPAYLAYQGDGDVKGELVYVNYGMKDDYDTLEKLGVSVKGKIVIARYGEGWRGLKPKLAQEHGAIGCIIYSDPHDDGYAQDAAYPEGPMRPPHGLQRGSVEDMTLYPGDPLTPGVGATEGAKRLAIADAPVILKIPAIPISYADARVLLESVGGQVAPPSWRGSLPITYRVGPGKAVVHLAVKSNWDMKPIYDVIAEMKGSIWPDQWIVRGNHHDGWVFGASDPLSGQVALLAEAKAIGELAATGWKPRRTIVYGSWDGEEPGLLGSTEWAETHADDLRKNALIYINTDGNGRGILGVAGSQDMENLVNGVAADLTDPETGASVIARMRAKIRLDALDPAAKEKDHVKAIAKMAADPQRDIPIEALGSGSDYASFLEHLGLPALNMEYHDEGHSNGVYHSRYDTFEHHSRFADPGFVYDSLLAKTVGRIVLRVANSDLPVQRAGDFAGEISQDFSEIKKLADESREKAQIQAGLLRDRAYTLSADPTKPHGMPTALLEVPAFDFAPLEAAVKTLDERAKDYDHAVANADSLQPEQLNRLQGLMRSIDQTLTSDTGLPGRPWYRNLIYAPGTLTGYGTKTLPGIREAIEQQRWADVERYTQLTADALNAYSARLEEATAVLNGR